MALLAAGTALLLGPGLLRQRGTRVAVSQPASSVPGQATTPPPPTSRSSLPRSSSTPPTSSTSTSSTISPQELARQVDGVDRLERMQPLTQHLPHDAAHFAIDYRVGTDGSLSLQVTLRAVLNRPDQLDQYREQLRAYKVEALDWLRSLGADPAAYRIDYLPPEAASL